jgi:DNA-binding LytR/AlgR family response regulator
MTTTIRVIIVEDKSLIAESIKVLLEKHEMMVVAMCASGEEAIEAAKQMQPDMVLMDIDLAGAMDGVSAAQMMLKDRSIPIIYLTDSNDSRTIDRAKQTFPASYMTKPFNEVDLIRAIDIAFNNANRSTSTKTVDNSIVFIRTDTQSYVKLDINEILYIQALRSYCDVVTEKRKYRMSNSLNQVHQQFEHPDLVRVQRSFVVNIKKVAGFEGNILKLVGDHEVQMGGEYRDSFLATQRIIR